MDEEKQTTCRVCLSSTKTKYVSLFKKHKNYLIVDQINSITSVHIVAKDGFPDQICRECLAELDTAVNFRQKCEGSNLILLNALPNSTFVPEHLGIVVKKEEPAEFEQADEFFDFEHLQLLDDAGAVTKTEKDTSNTTQNESLQCDDCKLFFKSKCKLRVHWKKTHLKAKLICPQCKRLFKSYIAYNRHMKLKQKSCTAAKDFRIEGEGKQRVFYCKECEYKTGRIKDIMTHLVTHTGDRPYKCDLCPKTCTQQSSLMAHKEAAHKEYKCVSTCQYCGKFLQGRNRIYRHLKLHTESRVQCKVCKKSFKNKTSLSQHMHRHSGTKSYTCEKCARSFYTHAELSNHKRAIHSNVKASFQCDLCGYKTSRKDTLKKHKSKHTDTNIPCTVCGMFFENTQKLILHQRRHFQEKKYGCPFCDLKFLRRDTVPKHIKAKHEAPYHAHKMSNQGSAQNINFLVKEEALDNNFANTGLRNMHESPIQIND